LSSMQKRGARVAIAATSSPPAHHMDGCTYVRMYILDPSSIIRLSMRIRPAYSRSRDLSYSPWMYVCMYICTYVCIRIRQVLYALACIYGQHALGVGIWLSEYTASYCNLYICTRDRSISLLIHHSLSAFNILKCLSTSCQIRHSLPVTWPQCSS
jgi:hypothetical protein